MKVLALVSKERLPDNRVMYETLAQKCALTVLRLESKQQKHLWWRLRKVGFADYDAVFSDLYFKRIHKQAGFMKKLPGLFLLEQDACQNYMPASEWHGAFTAFYRKLPNATVFAGGAATTKRLAAEGFDARYVPKGYDQTKMKNMRHRRDIKMGFIGRLKHNVYARRQAFLESLSESHGLRLLRTEPGDEYAATLNRIKYFISADIGLEEYMQKNFEAMGAGCVLCAWRQGAEDTALGMEDMKNIVLYSSEDELLAKIARLDADPGQRAAIQSAGEAHARKHLSFTAQAEVIYSAMRARIGA